MKEKLTIKEFCDRYDACSPGEYWARLHCRSMRDAWHKLPYLWFLWVAGRPGVLSSEIVKRFEAKFGVSRHKLRAIHISETYARQRKMTTWLRRHARPDFTVETHEALRRVALKTGRQTGKTASMIRYVRDWTPKDLGEKLVLHLCPADAESSAACLPCSPQERVIAVGSGMEIVIDADGVNWVRPAGTPEQQIQGATARQIVVDDVQSFSRGVASNVDGSFPHDELGIDAETWANTVKELSKGGSWEYAPEFKSTPYTPEEAAERAAFLEAIGYREQEERTEE